jgi:Domain of unknown function (DUF1998)
LVRADYLSLDNLAADDDAFANAPPELRAAAPETRRKALLILLDHLRHGLAITTDALDPGNVEAVANASRQSLREPWSISQQEEPRVAAALIIDAPRREEAGLRGETLIIRGGSRSMLARLLGRAAIWGRRLETKTYQEVVSALLAAAAQYQLVRSLTTSFDVEGWRLAANAVRLVVADGRADGRAANPYFTELYRTLADTLASGGEALFGIEGREHTAQVGQDRREWREWRFRKAALVVSYCAAQSPHDQYYFGQPREMVSGIVKPPALELANRDLVEAHLHAVWLADSARELANDIPHVLDLTKSALPVQEEIADVFADPTLTARSAQSMRRILHSIDAELTPAEAPWAFDRQMLADNIAANAASRCSEAFGRWRQLYDGARTQLIEANRRSEMHGLSAAERREAKSQQAQANEQIALLERGTTAGGSDFSTYRYLATEGFLPGYNFPRLPLYAYVPAVAGGGPKGAYLQRARFVAIAEFGPRSLIYHEGRAYRVTKAKLPPNIRAEDGGRLATDVFYVCDECGGAHQRNEPERCHVCRASMGGIHPIRDVLRIDNVETQPADRITANDEDRQRQGFDIQTVFAWPWRDGAIDVTESVASDEPGPILSLAYASGATISRLNKGLRRRKDKSIFGFAIDPATGRWTGSKGEGDDDAPDTPAKQRVVPIVQDNKNALLFQFPTPELSESSMATLQHALARGLEVVFQLEEGEVLTEPVPSRDRRRAILLFEATEGGAGVLGRLAADPLALAQVARAALELMHYRDIDAAAAAASVGDLVEAPDARCVVGCYRCLLSYYNQPDHELIDRRDRDAKMILLRLARCQVAAKERPVAVQANGDWRAALTDWGLPAPDGAPLTVQGTVLPLVWRTRLAAASIGSVDDQTRAAAEALGYAVVVLPEAPGDAAPPHLIELLGEPA